ncbi:hypothetical protein N7495_007847 [Penicillium taxi]|uniref:uncharacterized protein n=1 Tax=Penicillium taxi TaxID=168475 RepID=UPI0025451B8A|nr:uncharacterized protein N7495_007847 [Penicillium taxi]KAJ5887806.1 hypothetical protein N7495_007847 [Penicillium taxi]
MAFPGFSLIRSWILLVLACQSSAQFCSFWNGACIDPLAQTAVKFNFSPLFINPITLYYGFDASLSGKGNGPMTKTAFWLRYQNSNIDPSVVDMNRTSEIALRVGNLTGIPSGSNNACDGIWGRQCTNGIKMALKTGIFHLARSGEYYSKPLETVLSQLMMVQPELLCGAPIFDVASIPVQGMSFDVSYCFNRRLSNSLTDFAFESKTDQDVSVYPSGSLGHPWQVWYLDDMTPQQQASQVAVGIISRAPSYGSPLPRTPDDIQIELVCMQAPQAPPSGSMGND